MQRIDHLGRGVPTYVQRIFFFFGFLKHIFDFFFGSANTYSYGHILLIFFNHKDPKPTNNLFLYTNKVMLNIDENLQLFCSHFILKID